MKSKMIIRRMKAVEEAKINSQIYPMEAQHRLPLASNNQQPQQQKEAFSQNTLSAYLESLLHTKHLQKQDQQEAQRQQQAPQKEHAPPTPHQQPNQDEDAILCFSSNSKNIKSCLRTSSEHIIDSNSHKWGQHLHDLVNFRKRHGHCLVPHKWNKNISLANWVKRQRYEYKLKKHGAVTPLTDERQDALDEINFEWDAHAAKWEEQLNDLRAYRDLSKSCNVPSTCNYIPGLAHWVKSQRRQYRNFKKGKKSSLTHERIMKLNELGFIWNPRNLQLDG